MLFFDPTPQELARVRPVKWTCGDDLMGLEKGVIILLSGPIAERRAIGLAAPYGERMRLAFHEAGHATAATAAKFFCHLTSVIVERNIQIQKSNFMGGRTEYGSRSCHQSTAEFQRVRPAEGTAPTASGKFAPGTPRVVMTDYRQAAAVCYLLAGRGATWKETLRKVREFQKLAMILMEQNRLLIQILAYELDRVKRLDETRIDEILRPQREAA